MIFAPCQKKSANMADNRGMNFPGNQQPGTVPGYGMMTNMGVPFVPQSMQPVPNPMMQQQMMAPPGVMPQMYPMQMGVRTMAPPPYTPQMAQNFRIRTTAPRPARPQKELSEKERQFQVQQQRLKQFGKPGAVTADADKLIANMFGAEKPKSRNTAKPQHQAMTEDNDSFGAFMQGPSLAPQTPPSIQTPTLDNGQAAVSTGQSGISPQPEKKPKQEKKAPDLAAMMMECSDLNAPQKAKLFHKPSLKEVQVEHHSTTVFHQSDHSRQWTRTDNLDGLFASEPAPAPTVAKPTKKRHSSGASKAVVAKTSSGLPVWCEAPDDQLPPLYRHVYEATLVEGKIDTGRVYPILLLSGLARESLGTIWQMANKETPGQLIKSELYAVLALVALTQNNFNITSIEILLRCPQPPVPFLGPQSVAMVTQQAVSGQTGPGVNLTNVPNQALPPQAPPQVLPQGQAVPGQAQAHIVPNHVQGQGQMLPGGQGQPQMPPGPAQVPVGPQIPPTNQYPVQPQPGVPSPGVQQFPPQFPPQGPAPPVGHQLPGPPAVPIVSNVSGSQGAFPAAPSSQPPSSVPPGDDDFADFQTAAPASSSAKQEDNFGEFIGGAPAVIQPSMEEKPSYIFTVPKVDPELEVVSPDDKYNSNVRSFFCSSDSSTADASKHDSELKGQSTPSLDDEDFTDCRDSSQISTSEQSENEDIRAFESYVEEFHRKKEEREQNTQHRSLPTQTSRYSKPKVEPPQPIPSIPPLSQASKTASNDFTDFKSAPSAGSAGSTVTPVPNKDVYASQAAKAKQTVLTAAQRLASEADNEFTDFQEAPKPGGDKGLHPVASESDLLGEEDRYNALRVLVGDDVPTSVFAQPKKEDEDFADFDGEGEEEEDWSGFTVAQTASESSEQIALPNVQSVTSIGNASIMSLYGSERGEDRAEDWADFEEASEANTKTEAPAHEWAAFPGAVPEAPAEVRADYSALSTGLGSETVGLNDADDWGGFTDSSVGASDNTQKNNSDWSDFHTSSNTKQQSENILTVKKENLQTGEVLNVFKMKEEHSNYKLPNKPTSTRIPSAESDFDDDRIPPPMDNIEDDDDHNTFSRGYDLDDMVRHTAVTTAYSMFASTSHHYNHTKHKNDTKTTDSLRSRNERGHSLSPESQQTETDSSSSKDMDSWGWKDKLQGVREDSQSVSSLEFPNGKGLSAQKDSDNGGTDSQSVSSMEFGNFESSSRVPVSGECKSVDSLELYKKEEGEGEVEGEEDAQSDSQTGQVSTVPQSFLVGGEMRALADRYNIDGQVQGSNKHEYEWERCIDNCCRMIRDANTIFNSVSRSAVCNEVIKSDQGSEYVMGIIEIYRVSCRITAAVTASGIKTAALEKLIKDIDLAWNNLTAFFVGASVLPDATTLNFYHAVMKSDSQAAQQRACGLCLLDVDAKSLAFKQDEEIAKLTYGGRQYHAPCANFWVNCVDSTLPALRLPELL